MGRRIRHIHRESFQDALRKFMFVYIPLPTLFSRWGVNPSHRSEEPEHLSFVAC